jgi:hypothetical protein
MITVKLQHECYGSQVTVSSTIFAIRYKIKDPITTQSLYSLHSYTELATNLDCFTYELLDEFGGGPAEIPPFVTYNNQTLRFGPTIGGEIGQNPSIDILVTYKATNIHTS